MDWPALITASYERVIGRRLCDPGELEALPAVVLCHDTSPDPVFVYANRVARDLWEMPMVGMASRLSAPPQARAQRAAALASDSVVRGYSGLRVSASGQLFHIVDATVWPVTDETGTVRGQAATFRQWQFD